MASAERGVCGVFHPAFRNPKSARNMIEDKELAQLFKAESAEHLARLDDGLLRLEKTPADQALLEEVFRESHSLKGAARMLGLTKIETAAHGLETILNTALKGEAPLTPEVIERMTRVLGELRRLVQEALGGEPAETKTAEPLSEVQAHLPSPAGGITSDLAAVFGQPSRMASCSIRGAGGEGASTSFPTTPLSSSLPEGERAIVDAPPSIPQSTLRNPQSTEPFRIETVRVETRKLDDLLTLVGELSVIEGRAQHRLSLMDALLEQWALLEHSHKKGSAEYPIADFGLQIAELGKGIRQARDAFYEDGARLETTVNTLEEQVHAARLLPLSTVFALFPRMVHDLAKAQGKEVELIIEGGEIGVDKRILEEMKDPLMHLLRNAIDHGIEAQPERERQGKPRGGTVRLRALRENSTVLLEVRDDGHGLDLEAIRQVALKRGLHDETTLAAMTPAQLQQLIFLPGFSTSTFVTELSGRGVGLDVVRVNVERLKGDIRREPAPQQGTGVQVRLPLSLATTRLLLASVGDRLFGLPIEFVHTSRRVREEDMFTLEGRPAFELDGQPVIAPRLADLLGLPDSRRLGKAEGVPNVTGDVGHAALCPTYALRNPPTVCIVIQVGDERLGLRVDELLDEEEVVAKPLGAPLPPLRNVSGLTILGSGEICAVLNPADLLRTAHKMSAEFGLRNAE